MKSSFESGRIFQLVPESSSSTVSFYLFTVQVVGKEVPDPG